MGRAGMRQPARMAGCRAPVAALRSPRYGRPMASRSFLTDDSLALVARRLRALGFDVQLVRGARLEELFAAARDSGRIVLTLSDRRPSRRAGVEVVTLPRGDARAAVRMLAASFEPSGPPFGRCLECNHPLQRRFAAEARGEVPAGVARSAETLRFCPECGRWYWEGSHTARLREWLEAALGRPLAERGESG